MALNTKFTLSLVGLMGTGKSTLAAHLAAELGPATYPVCDLDQAIEASAHRSIAELFAVDGEPAFRALEFRVLTQVLAAPGPQILATGGGAPCSPAAIAALRAAGPVVWLDAPLSVLTARLTTPSAHRPLLARRSPSEITDLLRAQLAARRPYYAQADLHADATLTPAELARWIIHRLPKSAMLDPLP